MNGKTVLAFLSLLCTATVAAGATVDAVVRLEVDDLLGSPITSVLAGSDFLLEGFVQDIRNLPASSKGVFAAKLDASFDDELASAARPIMYGNDFSVGRSGTILPGEIHDVGASRASLIPPGSAAQFLFSLRVHAQQAGQLTFVPALSLSPGGDFLLYGDSRGRLEENIQFVAASITIVPEPSTFALAAAVAIGLLIRRFKC